MAVDAINVRTEERAWISTRTQARAGRALAYLALIVLVVAIGAPVYWMLTASVKTNAEIYTFPPQWIPSNPRWANFSDAWNAAPFDRFYIVSIVTTFFGTGLELINATLTAYALAYLRFPLKNLVFVIILATLMVPTQLTIIPNYLTISDVPLIHANWINTYQGIILPGAAVAFGTFMLRQGFLGLPREVLDAARVDGAGHLRTLWDIAIPMTKPIIVTFGLISMVAKWNDYLWPLIVTNEERMRPLAVGVSYLNDPDGNTQWGMVMAAVFFVIAPLIVVYLFAQRYIIEGIASGATKG
jgi:sn-glycerol 3-phosphate transport system permease protein